MPSPLKGSKMLPGKTNPHLSFMLDLYSTKGPKNVTNPMKQVKLRFINSGWKACLVPSINTDESDKQNLLLPKADLYLDCRVIPNPFLVKGVGSFTGENPIVQQWVLEHGQLFISSFSQLITDGIAQIPTRRKGKDDPFAAPYVICTMCAHGIHRSRAMKHLLADRFRKGGWNVEVQ